MELTKETRRTRWSGLFALWAVAAALLIAHAVVVRQSIDLLGSVGMRGDKPATTPLKRICPSMYADTQMWVQHALALAEGAGPQLRHTDVDNAPFGRDVHWDSGFAWLLVAAGKVQQHLSGGPFPSATEQALAWFNLPLLLGFVVFFSIWVARRVGLGGAVVVGGAMLGLPDFYSGFAPNYVDHHGVLAAMVFGLLLGAGFMGAGFLRPAGAGSLLLPDDLGAARRAAVMSAVCGAIGLWVSAATLVPAIAIVGVAAAVVILVFGPSARRQGVTLRPDLWRVWGRIGGGLSLAFYLLEYFPHHLGFRLEVNHPVYALAWWGGSEIIAQLAEWRGGGAPLRPLRLALSSLAIAVVPATIAIGGSRVFVVFDPFVARLSTHVAEGISIAKIVRLYGWGSVVEEIPPVVLTVLAAFVLLRRSERRERPIVAFLLLVVAAFLAMACAQLRWWPSASGPELCVLLFALAALGAGRSTWARWTCIAVPIVAVFLPNFGYRLVSRERQVQRRQVDPGDAIEPVYRDIAAALRASQPTGGIVLLSDPNASLAISYYGRFRSIGTLYWENIEGTKAAAEILSAETETEQRRLIRSRGVTHIALLSQDNFLAEYLTLLRPGADPSDLQKTFGYELLVNQQAPIWLERIRYEVPADAPVKPERVALYKVHLGPPRAEAAYDAAQADIQRGDLAAAEVHVTEALAIAPDVAEYALIKERLLLARGDVANAFTVLNSAIDHAAPVQQAALCLGEAGKFLQLRNAAAAVHLYRRALAVQFDPEVAGVLGWLLATARDDAVRNGAEALQLAARAQAERPDYATLSAYAAALAEGGRFNEAIPAAQRALDAARAANRPEWVAQADAHLAAYSQQRPWRE